MRKSLILVLMSVVLAGCVTVTITATQGFTVIAGSQGIVLLDLQLNGDKSPTTLSQLTFGVNVNGAGVNVLANVGLLIDGELAQTVNDPNAGLFDPDQSVAQIRFLLAQPLAFSANQQMTAQLIGDIATSAMECAIQASTSMVAGMSQESPELIQFGPIIQVVAGGEINVGTGGNSPRSGLLPANTSGISILEVALDAEREPVEISGLPIYFSKVNDGGPDQIGQVSVYHGADFLGSAVPSTDDSWEEPIPLTAGSAVVNFAEPLVLQPGVPEHFTIKVETGDCETGPAESGQGFTVFVPGEEIVGRGLDSNQLLGGIGQATSGQFTVFQSVPIVSILPLHGARLVVGHINNQILFPLAVTNGGWDDLALCRLTFKVQTQHVTASNFRVWREFQGVVGTGQLDADGLVIVDLEPQVIPDGQIDQGERLWLMADLNIPPGQADAAIVTNLVGDQSFPAPLPATYDEAASQAYFIWTDLHRSGPLGIFDPTLFGQPQFNSGWRVTMDDGSTLPSFSSPIILGL
jgi:hypothetical protein